MNRCPICAAKIPDHKLMCWKDWALAPDDLQEKVLTLWRTALRGRTASIRHIAMDEYRRAREETIAAVKARQTAQQWTS